MDPAGASTADSDLAARLRRLREQNVGPSVARPLFEQPADESSRPSLSSSSAAALDPTLELGRQVDGDESADAVLETEDALLQELLEGVDDGFLEQTTAYQPRQKDDKIISTPLPVSTAHSYMSAAGPTDRPVGGESRHDSEGDSQQAARKQAEMAAIINGKAEAELDVPSQMGSRDCEPDPPLHLPSVPADLAPAASPKMPTTTATSAAGCATLEDLTARMAALRSSISGSGAPADDEEVASLSLPSVPDARPSRGAGGGILDAAASAGSETNEDIDSWCIVCLDDATLTCLGCDEDGYCTRCWRDMHLGPSAAFDQGTHKAIQFTKRMRKGEEKQAAIQAS